MGPDTWAALSALGVAIITAVGGVWVARSGRRTRQQERRDDFTEITKALNDRIKGLKDEIGEQKAEMREAQRRITDQDATIGWLLSRVRGLVWYVRQSGQEPPEAPPMPERVRDYIQHLDL